MVELKEELKSKLEAKKNDSFLHFETNIIQEYSKELNLRLEYILRHCVTPPIKDPITKGKIKWRGITKEITYKHTTPKEGKLVCNCNIIVRQRGEIVQYDELDYKLWKNYKLRHEAAMLQGSTNHSDKRLLEQIYYD